MSKLTLAYLATTFGSRSVFCTRWATIFAAREGVKFALSYFRGEGFSPKIWKHFEHEPSGEFEVWLIFGEQDNAKDVESAVFVTPHCSNRGVTGFLQEKTTE